MPQLTELQNAAITALKKRLDISPVSLKHPFPERPLRTLGLISLDGQVFTSEKLLRMVFLQIRLPVFFTVYSTFIRPHVGYDLPVLSCEVVCMGKKRLFVLDIHGTEVAEQKHEKGFFDHLCDIRSSYPRLLQHTKTDRPGAIESMRSRAACRIVIASDIEEHALQLFLEYLQAYIELSEQSRPLRGEALAGAAQAFERYLTTIIKHDPGVKGNIMFFGKKGGLERALDIFFGK